MSKQYMPIWEYVKKKNNDRKGKEGCRRYRPPDDLVAPGCLEHRLTHRVPAARNVANLGAGQNQVFVAHDLGGDRRYLRRDRPLQLGDLVCIVFVPSRMYVPFRAA
jgi:hypothetical protein